MSRPAGGQGENALSPASEGAATAIAVAPVGVHGPFDRDDEGAYRSWRARKLDRNWFADDDGVSQVSVAGGGTRADFIPYADRPIRWHTDGYCFVDDATRPRLLYRARFHDRVAARAPADR